MSAATARNLAITASNGLNPLWPSDQQWKFTVYFPELALLRFNVFDADFNGQDEFIGQSVLPLESCRTGYRSVPLRNAFSEPLEVATLLVHVTRRPLDDPCADACKADGGDISDEQCDNDGSGGWTTTKLIRLQQHRPPPPSTRRCRPIAIVTRRSAHHGSRTSPDRSNTNARRRRRECRARMA